jgi:hypothetical protein
MKREKYVTDIGAVARGIAAQTKGTLGSDRFPHDYVTAEMKAQPVQLGNVPIELASDLMLGQRTIQASANGKVIWQSTLPQHVAELFIRAVQLGQRDFPLPLDDNDAQAILGRFESMTARLDAELTQLTVAASPGAQAQLRSLVEVELNFPVALAHSPIPAAFIETY